MTSSVVAPRLTRATTEDGMSEMFGVNVEESLMQCEPEDIVLTPAAKS